MHSWSASTGALVAGWISVANPMPARLHGGGGFDPDKMACCAVSMIFLHMRRAVTVRRRSILCAFCAVCGACPSSAEGRLFARIRRCASALAPLSALPRPFFLHPHTGRMQTNNNYHNIAMTIIFEPSIEGASYWLSQILIIHLQKTYRNQHQTEQNKLTVWAFSKLLYCNKWK